MTSETLKRSIGDSVLPMPEGFLNTAKFIAWKAIYPLHMRVKNMLLALHIIHHEGRQEFVLGKLASNVSVQDFVKYLETQRFGNHFVAWQDDDELIGVRRLE